MGIDFTLSGTIDAGDVVRVIKELQPVEFTDTSTNANNVMWDFGDGNSSTERNPIHNYSSNGTFIVTLTAYNDFGQDTTTQTVVVSGIGEDFYDTEEETEEEVVEEEVVEEEVVEEEVIEEESTYESSEQDVQNTDIFEMDELTLDKDDEDGDKDYGYEGDFSLDAGSTSSGNTEDTTTQQTTEEQQGGRSLTFPLSPLGEFQFDTKSFIIVDDQFDTSVLSIGLNVLLIGNQSEMKEQRVITQIIDDGRDRGILIDTEITIQDEIIEATVEV